MYGKAIDDEAGVVGEIASFEDGIVDRHRQFARAFGGEDGIVRFEPTAPRVFFV